jgi:hypothetical protein
MNTNAEYALPLGMRGPKSRHPEGGQSSAKITNEKWPSSRAYPAWLLRIVASEARLHFT